MIHIIPFPSPQTVRHDSARSEPPRTLGLADPSTAGARCPLRLRPVERRLVLSATRSITEINSLVLAILPDPPPTCAGLLLASSSPGSDRSQSVSAGGLA
jgi:hypothetical protein